MTEYLKPGGPQKITAADEANFTAAHQLHYLAMAVKDMRRKQTRYFRTKDPKAKQQYLKEAIVAEGHVDKEAAAIIAGQPSTLPASYIHQLLNPNSNEQTPPPATGAAE